MRNQLRFVQALRFLAAVLVVIVHACAYTAQRFPGAWSSAEGLGHLGVWLFFSISGFVMVFVTDRELATSGQVRAARFLRKRLARIVPLYWTMTAVKLVLTGMFASQMTNAKSDPLTVLRSLLFIPVRNEAGDLQPVWGVGWTLVFEASFYVLVAAALLLRVDPVRLAAPVLCGASLLWLLRPESGSAMWFYADPAVLCFLAGMLIARQEQKPVVHTVAAIVTLSVFIALLHSVKEGEPSGSAGVSFFAISALLCAAVRYDSAIRTYIPRWLAHGGTTSYSLYMLHPLIGPGVVWLVQAIAPAAPWPIPVCLAVVAPVLVAPLAYRHFERPLNALVARLAKGSRHAPDAEPTTHPAQCAATRGTDTSRTIGP